VTIRFLKRFFAGQIAAWLDAELASTDLGALNPAKDAVKAWYHKALGVR